MDKVKCESEKAIQCDSKIHLKSMNIVIYMTNHDNLRAARFWVNTELRKAQFFGEVHGLLHAFFVGLGGNIWDSSIVKARVINLWIHME